MQIALCPDLSDPANGAVTQFGNRAGDNSTFVCDEGYELDGAPVLNCQDDGTWDNPPPTCKRESSKFSKSSSQHQEYDFSPNPTALCPDQDNPANGVVVQTGNSEGDTASYTCDSGYYLVGPPVLNCQADGTWDDSPPICRREFLISL